jgi:hypothetical protein
VDAFLTTTYLINHTSLKPGYPHSAYRHIVGALQYCTLTRLDIAYIVNQLCQFIHAPTSAHFTPAKRVLHYLKGTTIFGLHYTKGSLHPNGYCDSI